MKPIRGSYKKASPPPARSFTGTSEATAGTPRPIMSGQVPGTGYVEERSGQPAASPITQGLDRSDAISSHVETLEGAASAPAPQPSNNSVI